MSYSLENCAYSAWSALEAQKGGSDRVELCSNPSEGGTTPSYGEILAARKFLSSTRLHVIIRPRGGDFVYDESEIEIMMEDIKMAKKIGADGVVFGCLTRDGEIDSENLKKLIQCSEGMSLTFHKAFDVCKHPFKALEEIISLGFHRILTSGQQPNAELGIELIRELHKVAAGRIIIMPGGGVTVENIEKIALSTGVSEFHSSAKKLLESGVQGTDIEVVRQMKGILEYLLTPARGSPELFLRKTKPFLTPLPPY